MKRGKFIEFLVSTAAFTEAEKKLIFENCETLIVEKSGYILRQGEVCTKVYFILKGILRFYTVNEEGEEITNAFLCEGEVATRIESFLKGTPSNGYLQCVTPCEFVTISKNNWTLFCEKTKNFGYAMGQIGTLSLSKMMEIQRKMLTDDAQSAYQDFVNLHPEFHNRIPMKYIASYLGITPSSLSRIKKEITEK